MVKVRMVKRVRCSNLTGEFTKRVFEQAKKIVNPEAPATMPKIKAILALEFDADGADQGSIDTALDQVLVLQPSCKIVSKVITEVDRKAVNTDTVSQPNAVLGVSRHALLGHENGILGNSYRAGLVERNRDHHGMDSYEQGRLDGHSHRAVDLDSCRPKGEILSDQAGPCPVSPPFSDKPKEPPDWRDRAPQAGQLNDGQILPTTTYNLGVGSDAGDEQLIQDTVFRPQAQSPAPTYEINHDLDSDHYSPPPASRRDRSASPAGEGLRRSVRLRAAASANKDDVRSAERRSQEPQSDLRRRTSFSNEKHESRLQTVSRRRLEGLKRTEVAEPDSLEGLACKSVVSKESRSERKKFERQQERNGITEALRLKKLRSARKMEKARLRFDKQRWGGREVKAGARMDAVIAEFTSFDFNTPSARIKD